MALVSTIKLASVVAGRDAVDREKLLTAAIIVVGMIPVIMLVLMLFVK